MKEERIPDRNRHLMSHSKVEHGSLAHLKEEGMRIWAGLVWLSTETIGGPV
jgi:hypothetical protein